MQLHHSADYARKILGAETLAHVDGVWHGFGKQLKADANVDELLDTAGIGWSVTKEAIYRKKGDVDVAIPGKRALVRDDGKAFDIVGKDWQPLQNRTLAEFADRFREAGALEWIGAGACGNGSKVFIQAKTKAGFQLFQGKDAIEQIITFYSQHKHGTAVSVSAGANRLWCANQVSGLDAKGKKVAARFHHVDGAKGFNPESALKLLNATNEAFEIFREKAEALAAARTNERQVESYLRDTFDLVDVTEGPAELIERSRDRNQRVIERLINVHHTQPGVKCGEGTWWQAFNTVTYFVDHCANKNEDARVASALVGAGEARKLKALALAVAGARN